MVSKFNVLLTYVNITPLTQVVAHIIEKIISKIVGGNKGKSCVTTTLSYDFKYRWLHGIFVMCCIT